jgi:hypothetical protein
MPEQDAAAYMRELGAAKQPLGTPSRLPDAPNENGRPVPWWLANDARAGKIFENDARGTYGLWQNGVLYVFKHVR